MVWFIDKAKHPLPFADEVTVRFRDRARPLFTRKGTELGPKPKQQGRTAVMKLPRFLRDKSTLDTSSGFVWQSLDRALFGTKPTSDIQYAYIVTGVGWEGTPIGGEMVVHVQSFYRGDYESLPWDKAVSDSVDTPSKLRVAGVDFRPTNR